MACSPETTDVEAPAAAQESTEADDGTSPTLDPGPSGDSAEAHSDSLRAGRVDPPSDADALRNALGQGTPATENLGYWTTFASPSALFQAYESVETLTDASSLVVVGEVVSVNDGRSYKSQEEGRVAEAGPLPGFRWVELNIKVHSALTGDLPHVNDDGTITVDVWRAGEAPQLSSTTPPEGSRLLLFLAHQGSFIDDESRNQLFEAFGPEEGQRYIDDSQTRYAIVGPQGLVSWDGEQLALPLTEETSPDAEGEAHDDDPLVEKLNSVDLDSLQTLITAS